MQNSTLPIFTGAPAATNTPAPQRQNSAPSSDGAQFAQTLSRQVQQRQQEAAQAERAQPVQPIKVTNTTVAPPPGASQPTRSQIKPPAESAEANKADATADSTASTASTATAPAGDSKAASTDKAADAKTGDDGSTPVADLIAIVASFNQPAAAPVAADAAAQGDTTKRPDQLAAQSDQMAAADARLLAPAAAAALPVQGAAAGAKAEPGQALSQMFEHARGAARSAVAATDTAATAPAKGAAADAGADALGTATAAATNADAKPAAFASMVQAHTDATPARAERAAELLTAREPAPTAPLSAPVQQASLSMAAAINQAGAAGDRLAARVGTPAWDNQVGQKIIFMAAGQEQSATLTLNPPDLGPMQVVLSVSNDMAQVTFSAAQPEVRQALEQAMPKLREMMSESGLSLGNATVNDGAADQRQAQQSDGQGRGNGGRGGFQNGGDGKVSGAAIEVPVRRGRILGGEGAVDTFA